MNGTYQVLAYADDVNWTIERNADILLIACKNTDLASNTEKTKYTNRERVRGMIANEHIRIGSNSYENVKTLKYLGSLFANENYIYE
jgi:hypothetical protein